MDGGEGLPGEVGMESACRGRRPELGLFRVFMLRLGFSLFGSSPGRLPGESASPTNIN